MGKGGIWKYITLGILSGLFSFLFINLLTHVIKLITSGEYKIVSKEYLILFSFIILFIVWIRRTLATAIISLTQTLFWSLRKQILNAVLKANYNQFIAKKSEIYSSIVSDVNTLTNASTSIIDFSTSTIVAIACLIYLLTISWVLFLITLSVAILGALIYHIRSKGDQKHFKEVRELENKFIDNLNKILNGFKEIYMEPKKGSSIMDNQIEIISSSAYQKNVTAFTGFLNNQIIGQILFYILISSILLFFSVLLKIETSKIVSYIFILLYLLSSIETIMVILPMLMRAKIAAKHLTDLKLELENSTNNNIITNTLNPTEEFKQITIKNLEFGYLEGVQTFSIGPIDFNVNKSEVIFIYGGNGSGKTTFIYSLLGLHKITQGQISLNDTIIDDANYQNYRSFFSVIFSDFYLFNELLIDEVDINKYNYYLELFEIENKVKLNDKQFSTIDLSTGQRKRLALISVLLEKKPIIVLDEWAADQDPYFRKKFYTEIIPILKQEGFTIIAITHDDKYYICADKLYKMEFGKLIPETISQKIIAD